MDYMPAESSSFPVAIIFIIVIAGLAILVFYNKFFK